MDFVPFTVFFMAYLISFQENVVGKPAVADMEVSVPDDCKKDFIYKNFCITKPTNYPSDEYLKKLYYDNFDNLDFRFGINETIDRVGENICSRSPMELVKNIYIIRDVSGDIRYTLHIPGVFEMTIPTTNCKSDTGLAVYTIPVALDWVSWNEKGDGLFSHWTGLLTGMSTVQCIPVETTMLDSWYTSNKIKCEQKTFQYPFIVLSRDKRRLESVKILGMNSSCVPVRY